MEKKWKLLIMGYIYRAYYKKGTCCSSAEGSGFPGSHQTSCKRACGIHCRFLTLDKYVEEASREHIKICISVNA